METNTNQLTKTLKKYWRGKGTRLRLTTFGWGASTTSILMLMLYESEIGVIAFLLATILCNILTWMMLNEIYYMDAVEEALKETNNGVRLTKKKAKNVVRFAKIFSILGSTIAAYAGIALMVLNDSEFYWKYRHNLYNMVTFSIFLTVWIPFIMIVIGKFIMKRRPAKHQEKVAALVQEITAAAEGSMDGVNAPQQKGASRFKQMPVLQMVTAVACMVGVMPLVLPLLPTVDKELENAEIIAEGEYLPEMSGADEAADTSEKSEEDWYNDANSNGYKFSISEGCLEAYLAYVQSEEAKYSFRKVQENKESYGFAGGATDTELSYFAIAGMEKREPFLILASTNEANVSDELAFYGYTDSCEVYYNGSFEQDYDMLSMSQSMLVNDLYVFCVEKKDGIKFYEETELVSHNNLEAGESHSNIFWQYYYQDGAYIEGKQWDEREACMVKALEQRHEIARVKWFSIDETDAARAYFSQFIKEGEVGIKAGPEREAYYSSTILQYMPYVDTGYFEVMEFDFGTTEYRVGGLTHEQAYTAFVPKVSWVAEFDGGSAAATDSRINIFMTEDGTYRALKRIVYEEIEESGSYMLVVYELTDEEAIVQQYNLYNHFEEEVSSLAEILERKGR